MKQNISTPIYLNILFLHIFSQLVIGYSQPIYVPVDNITLACGSSGDKSTYDPRTWSGDIDSKFSPFEADSTTKSQVSKAPPSPTARVPYTWARLSHSEFTYRFPLTTGQKFIRLYFRPASYPGFNSSKAFFSVKAGGFTLLKDFNAYAYGEDSTLYREYSLNIGHEQSINITFTPNSDGRHAFINGIEIVSMPTDLYYSTPENSAVKYVGNKPTFPIENITAMEKVYRLNVGGSSIDPGQDTGMYRMWDGADDTYLDDTSKMLSVLPANVSIQLIFSSKTPNYTAPEAVYNSARSMGPNRTINLQYNLTWEFPVDPKFFYLVRLHFCEFEPEINNYGVRRFLIYIANLTAEDFADVFWWSGGNGKPVYKDYVVFMPSSQKKKVNLSLVLQANPSGNALQTLKNDAILNGLEIFKLNNSMGILAGPNPDPPPPKATPEKPSGNKKSTTPLLAIVAGVVSTVLVLSVLGFFVFRRRGQVKDSGSSHGIKWGPFYFATTKSTKSHGSSLPSYFCHQFSLAEIKTATKN